MREMGIPLTPLRAARVLIKGDRRVVDVGRVNGRAFLLMVGVGLDGEVAHEVEQTHLGGLRKMIYYVGARTAVGVGRCDRQYAQDRFVQNSVGLHHMCFRARSREDVDAVHTFLRDRQAKIVHPPEEGSWAPGYYSVLFEDPAGIRLEVNYVPGKGVLAEGVSFNPSGDYQ